MSKRSWLISFISLFMVLGIVVVASSLKTPIPEPATLPTALVLFPSLTASQSIQVAIQSTLLPHATLNPPVQKVADTPVVTTAIIPEAPTITAQPTAFSQSVALVASSQPIRTAVPLVTIPLPPAPVPNQIVIHFNPATSAQERAAYIKQIGGTVTQTIDALNTVVIHTSGTISAQVLPQSALVAASEPDYYVVALDGPNDPLYPQQWAMPVMNVPTAWSELPTNTPSVTVAVIDSGICATHPDMVGRILAGYDFVQNDATPQDDYGHGCEVSGIIAANMNNNIGIAGVAPNAKIMPLRVLDAQGSGTYSNVATAIVYATDNGAKIINLSLGGSAAATVLEDAVNYAASHNVLVIAAAGNTGGSVLYPAAYPAVIAVASVDSNLQLSSFSSYGPEIDIRAPGRDITTTSRDGAYATVSGTSFAAPQVAGVAALEQAMGQTLNLGIDIVVSFHDGIAPTPTLTPSPTPDTAAINTLHTLLETKLTDAGMLNSGNQLIVLHTDIQLPYAVVSYAIINPASPPALLEPEVAVASYSSSWTVLVKEVDGATFNTTLNALPNTLLSADSKVLYAYNAVGSLANYSNQYLPWQDGVSHAVTQFPGTGGHVGLQSGAWDFAMPAGTEIWASQAGTVKWIQESNTANSFTYQNNGYWCTPTNAPPNYIVVNNDDGSASLYMHLQTNGVPNSLTVGSRVNRADVIGYSGNTGSICTASAANQPPNSTAGAHLHFQVEAQSLTKWYTQSGNISFIDPNWNSSQTNPVSGNVRTSNDDFDTPRIIPTSSYTYNTTQLTTAATLAGDDPVFACSSGQKNNTVWYRYIPTQGGTLTIQTFGSSYDTVLAVWTGNRGSLVSKACNDDDNGIQSRVNLLVTGGTTYYIEAAGFFSGGGTLKLSSTLVVPSTPATPILTSPSPKGVLINDATPDFHWNTVTNGYQYHIQIDNNPNFSSLEAESIVMGTTFTPTIALNDGLYYWRVQAININNLVGSWSAVWQFKSDTIAPNTPLLLAPFNNPPPSTQNKPTFSWSSVATAVRYQLLLDTVNPPIASVQKAALTTYKPPSGLLPTTYYWCVKAIDAAGNASACSPIRSLSFVSVANAAPSRNLYVSHTPTLTWMQVSWAKSYQLQIDNNADFSSPEYSSIITSGAATSQTITTALPNGLWNWRLRALKSDGTWGTWSAIDSFVIIAP